MTDQIQSLPPVMTTDEAAKWLRCEPETVARYVHSHDLVAVYVGKKRRIRAEDLLEFIARRPETKRE